MDKKQSPSDNRYIHHHRGSRFFELMGSTSNMVLTGAGHPST